MTKMAHKEIYSTAVNVKRKVINEAAGDPKDWSTEE